MIRPPPRPPLFPSTTLFRSQLLPGARLAADEHGDSHARDLGDLLARPSHGSAVPDDAGERDALLRLALAPALAGPVRLERLGDHRSHHAEEALRALVVAGLGVL